MSAIYIHIPYCKSKCHYCNFYSTANQANKSLLLQSINKELELRNNYLKSSVLETIYFGGGTPSILNNDEIEDIFTTINKNYIIDSDCEITFELNPDDISTHKLQVLKKLGVNRLSIGIQSFNNDILKKLNRKHTAESAVRSVELAKSNGFTNISIDLIYGIPGLTKSIWEQSLEIFNKFDIPHLSSYFLTVEENTALEVLIRKGKYPKLIEKEGISHFEYLQEFCDNKGYEQYEISNFAKKGLISKHNTNYWNRKEYLGIGPSAHSFNGVSRQWNISSISKYIKDASNGFSKYEIEVLSEKDKFNEYVMLGLRTSKGIDLDYINNKFGDVFYNYIKEKISNYRNTEFMNYKKSILILTKKGKMHADGIASYLFMI